MEIFAFFDAVPYILRILLSLCSILLFQKLTKRLDIAMAAGILLLGLSLGHAPAAFAGIAGDRLFSFDTLFLSLVIAGVIWLSDLMSRAGIMKDLVLCLKSRLSKRTILAVLPAVVGLLPMPGGALFSCPMLDDADEASVIPPEMKTRLNYWFRHLWEFVWPLYPGVLLAVDVTGLPLWKLALLMSPMYFVANAAGFLFLLRKTPQGAPEASDGRRRPFLPLVLPIITVIGVYVCLLVVFPALGRLNSYLPMLAGVAASLVVMQRLRPNPRSVWRSILLSRRWMEIVVIVALTRVYGAFIEGSLPGPGGGLLMHHVRGELSAYGIPVVLLVVLVPFVSGLSTGLTVGYIGASFPVILSLAGDSAGSYFSTVILGFSCGFLGMILSPIHICLIVTNQYFKTSLAESLTGLLKPAGVLFLFAAGYAGLWRGLG